MSPVFPGHGIRHGTRALALLGLALVLPACDDEHPDDPDAPPSAAPPAAARSFSSSLSGNQEVPRVLSFGDGTATFEISGDRRSVRFTLDTRNLVGVTMAHIHAGALGVDGPIIFDLSATPFTGPISGTLTETDFRPQPGVASFVAALDAIERGATFVNVHTLSYPDGEIRGQIGPAAMTTGLSGAQVRPALSTSGSGASTLVLNEDQTELSFTLEVAGLGTPPTRAELRVAPSGLNGPAIFMLAPTTFDSPLRGTIDASDLMGQPTAGVITFADAVDALLSGNVYVSVPTAANPSGELRGQFGTSTIPPTVSTGSGSTLTMSQNEVAFELSRSLGTVPVAWVQIGLEGPILFTLTPPIFTLPLRGTVTPTDLRPAPAFGVNTFDDALNLLRSGQAVLVTQGTTGSTGEVLRP